MTPRPGTRLAVLTLLILSGLLQGHRTGRWWQPAALQAASARLDRVPGRVGDWQGRPLTLTRKQLEIGEISGYAMRVYTNRKDGREVQVLLVCGRPGPISVHTPEVCLGASGYAASGAAALETIPGTGRAGPAVFRSALFRKDAADRGPLMRVMWAWNARGDWEAPESPRVRFAPAPFLYKLYVSHDVASSDAQADDPACREFLRDFAARLGPVLFPPTGPEGT